MATETERKFLVNGEVWRSMGSPIRYRQGYLAADAARTVRIRVAGDRAYLTIKGKTQGISRPEYEYEIPLSDAEELLMLCDRPLIEKTRTKIPFNGLVWEVDEFFGENQGLVMAEVELQDANQAVAPALRSNIPQGLWRNIDLPDWIGAEVSADSRYYNANLAKHPFTTW